MSIIILVIYNELADHGSTFDERRIAAQSTAGMMFFVNLNVFMLAYMTTLVTFNTERIVIVRERANQMYSIFPYYFARTMIETPLFLIIPLVYCAIFYFAVGLQ